MIALIATGHIALLTCILAPNIGLYHLNDNMNERVFSVPDELRNTTSYFPSCSCFTGTLSETILPSAPSAGLIPDIFISIFPALFTVMSNASPSFGLTGTLIFRILVSLDTSTFAGILIPPRLVARKTVAIVGVGGKAELAP